MIVHHCLTCAGPCRVGTHRDVLDYQGERIFHIRVQAQSRLLGVYLESRDGEDIDVRAFRTSPMRDTIGPLMAKSRRHAHHQILGASAASHALLNFSAKQVLVDPGKAVSLMVAGQIRNAWLLLDTIEFETPKPPDDKFQKSPRLRGYDV